MSEIPESQGRGAVVTMFDRIAPHYDTLNRLLSLRRDVAWRKSLVRGLPRHGRWRLLDVAAGTGDIACLAAHRSNPPAFALGLDPGGAMLRLAKRKAARVSGVCWVEGDALRVPVADGVFDAVTCVFGIRNMSGRLMALREMRRVLKPGAGVHILELSLPRNALLRRPYLFYFRRVLPWVGGWISGDRSAYRYLNSSVESFPEPSRFSGLMREAGFDHIEVRSFSFGIATLYRGQRPSESATIRGLCSDVQEPV